MLKTSTSYKQSKEQLAVTHTQEKRQSGSESAVDGLYFSLQTDTPNPACRSSLGRSVSFCPGSKVSRVLLGFMTEVTATRTSVNMRDQSNVTAESAGGSRGFGLHLFKAFLLTSLEKYMYGKNCQLIPN